MRPFLEIARNVLPEIGELQRRAGGVGKPLALGIAVAAQVQHQPAHGIRRIAAVAEQIVPGLHSDARSGPGGRRSADRGTARREYRRRESSAPARQTRDGTAGPRSRGRVHCSHQSSNSRARERICRLRRPDRRPSGSRRRHCRNAGASAAAAARRPRENFRSDAWPASACSAPPARPGQPGGGSARAISSSAGECMAARGRPVAPAAGARAAQRLRNHRDFHLAVAILHVLEHRGQLAQRDFRVDEVARREFRRERWRPAPRE